MYSKKIILINLILLSFISIKAHPGIGLVYDGDKTIYYTDLKQVWRLNIETGQKEIAVKDVHTHELHLDKDGNLYGEHYWYVESEQKFKHYIWQMNKGGKIEKIREDQYGENYHFSFVRDTNFISYELQKADTEYRILKKDEDSIAELGQIKLKNPTWKYLSKSGNYYFVDYPSIYKSKGDKVIQLVENISKSRIPFSTQRDRHKIYGIWTDAKENVYVAIYGGRVVRKINEKLEVSTVLKSSLLWSPVNGLFDKNGNLWLMESKLNGKIRVRKVNKQDLEQINPFIIENILLISGVILIGLVLILLIKRFRSTKAKKRLGQSKRLSRRLVSH